MNDKKSNKELLDNQPPLIMFEEWLSEAQITEPNNSQAMTLATCDNKGKAYARTVLLKNYDSKGFYFATNYESNKGVEMLQSNQVTLLFYWKSLKRQVRIEGTAKKTGSEISDKLFYDRPKLSQIASLLSKQSRELASRSDFIDQISSFPGSATRPDNWGGIIVVPDYFEFWQDGAHRVHERDVFTKKNNSWVKKVLYP